MRAQAALDFLLKQEQNCEDSELFIIGYVISIVSLLDQAENFLDEFKQMVESTIEQDQLNDDDKQSVQDLVQQISKLA